MGSGRWSADVYDRVTRSNIDNGSAFAYTTHAFSTGNMTVHPNLDVMRGGKVNERESRDSNEHPESTPIIIAFDETGSMGENPRILQKALKKLFGMLIRQDVVADPQVAIGAYGDAYYDDAPLQFSQFESDNRIDENLDDILIEGCGGGNGGETSTLLAWYVANHVHTDAYEKRGKRGYAFIIGDERALEVTRRQVSERCGDSVEGNVTPDMAFGAMTEKWDTYFLAINNYACRYQHSIQQYGELLGPDHVIVLEDANAVAATIVSLIAYVEGTVEPEEMTTALAKAGFTDDEARSATLAIAANHPGDMMKTKDVGRTGDRSMTMVRNDYPDLDL